MRRIDSFTMAALTCLGIACGRGVSSNPFAEATGGDAAIGSEGSSAATGGTVASGGSSGTGGPGEGKPNGSFCSDDDECGLGYCANAVCCEAACDGPCERCRADGSCAGCPNGNECTEEGTCRLSVGETCEADADCVSKYCAPTRGGPKVCCGSDCNGLCEACGSDGTCNGYPATDDSCEPVMTCPPKTPCVTYRLPAPNECSQHGKCAECEPTYTRRDVPCGVGSQCNGKGDCLVNGRGRFAAGERHTCGITRDGNVVCWGDNTSGQLGAVFNRERVGFDEVPALVPGLEIDFRDDVWQITAGKRHTCVLFAYGGVRCWGSIIGLPIEAVSIITGTLDYERVPNRPFINPLYPEGDVILPNPEVNPAVQISAASDGATICALLLDGNVSCWGDNADGQLGLGNTSPLNLSDLGMLPFVELGEPAVEVRSGFAHTCVRTESGRVQCWGAGTAGQLGYGNIENLFSPKAGDGAYVDIGGLAVTGLALGHDHTCTILEGGAVRCWGENNLGQLGYGHTEKIGDNETPAQAADLEGPAGREILGGDVHFGDNIIIEQIVTLAPSRSTCALSAARAVRCWGQNDFGELGYGHNYDGAAQYTPYQLETDVTIDGGEAWGGPVQLGGDTLALAEGGRCAFGTRTDGDLFCWGDNAYGQTGVPQGRDWSRMLTPVQAFPVHWWAQ